MASLRSIILPVLDGMPSSHLKVSLLSEIPKHKPCFDAIERAFAELTSRRQDFLSRKAAVMRALFPCDIPSGRASGHHPSGTPASVAA